MKRIVLFLIPLTLFVMTSKVSLSGIQDGTIKEEELLKVW